MIWAANVHGGAYYSGAKGTVMKYHRSSDGFIDGSLDKDWYDVRIDSSNDMVTVHKKQMKKISKL